MSEDPSIQLRLTLFGPPQIVRGDGTPVALRSRKHLALLVYLVVEQRRAWSRDTLLALLWPEAGEDAARNNLRVALADLRRALGDDTDRLLHTTRHTVQFNPASDHTLDVLQFRALLHATQNHPHETLLTCAACRAHMEQAVALYGGEFLHGFSLPDSSAFDEWALVEREQLHQQVLETLHTLATVAERQGDYAAQCRAARRQIALEPWREAAYVQLMRGLWASGQRGAALEQYDACVRMLAEELGIEPDAATTALYVAMKNGTWHAPDMEGAPTQPGDVHTSAPSTRAVTNLPTPLTPCIGRDAELADLLALARSSDVRLITLMGVGGIGKTHLSIALGHARLHECTHGVVFVQLAPLGAPFAIAPAILAALGIAVASGDPGQMLVQTLRAKQMLLILDNFEHLLDGADIVTDILQSAPQVEIVVTSRERLNLRGEHPYLLHGLAYAQQATLAEATDAAAVRVFVLNAKRVHRTFKLHADNLDAVLRICHLVEGLPLGLELAAAWTESLGPTEIAREIERSADFLHSEWRDVPQRHHSIRAVFDWSWQLLNGAERRVVRGFSLFRGGCTREAAEAVIDAPLRVLTRLTHTSVLRWVPTPSGAGRYTMHPLLRQFAADQLDTVPDERASVAARHAHYYLNFVAEREHRLTCNESREAAAEIRGELDNVRQAWAWAATHAHLDTLERAAYGLGHFYLQGGLHVEGVQAIASAAAHIGDTLAHTSSAAPAQQRSQRLLSMLLSIQAMGLKLQSDYDQALRLAQQAVALGHASGGVEGEAMGAIAWGEMLTRRGNHRDARPLFERALRLAREATQSHTPSVALGEIEWWAEIWLGIVAQLADDFAAARSHIAQAWQICHARGALVGEMTCLHRLATIAIDVGDDAAARHHAEQALELGRALSYPWGEGMTLLRLGQSLHALGEHAQAADVLERALTIFREIGDRTYEASTLAALGRLAGSTGENACARERLEQALAVSRAVQAHEPTFDALVFLSLLSHNLGDHDLALAYAEQAWPIAQGMGSRLRQAQVLVARGHALSELQRCDEAEAAYGQALTLYTEIGVGAPLTDAPRAGLAALALVQTDLKLKQVGSGV